MIERVICATKEDWEKKRNGYFTSSKSVVLLGEPKLKADKDAGNLSAAAETYVEERTATLLAPPKPNFYDADTEWGNTEEPQAVLALAEKLGLDVNSPDFIYTSDGGYVFLFDNDYNAGGTPDVIINAPKRFCGEIKCPNSKTHLKYLRIKTPAQFAQKEATYYNQIQQNIWLTESELCYFVSYDSRYHKESHRLHILEIPRNDEHIATLKMKLKKAKALKEEILTNLPK